MLDSMIAHLVELMINEPEEIAKLLPGMVLVDVIGQLLTIVRTADPYKQVSELKRKVKR